MWQTLGVRIKGFVINNPNPGGEADRPNPFQPPGGHPTYQDITNITLRYPF